MNRIFYFSSLIFAFTFPLSRAAVSFFIIWFIVLFLIRRDYRNAWERISNRRVFHIMGAFLAFMAVSYFWSSDSDKALNQIRLYGYWIIIPILAVNLKREWLPNIITAFLGGMLISEVIAYGIYFEWWTFKDRTPDYPTPFMSHIHYSIFLAFTSAILLSRLLSNRYTWTSKLPMALFFITATGNLMLSTGRTGQLAFLVAMGIAIIIHYRLTFRSLVIFTLLSTFLFVGAYSTLELFKKRIDQGIEDVRHLDAGNFNTSWGLRAAFWLVTYDIVLEHPVLGAGVGDYRLAAREVLERNEHNLSPNVIAWCGDTHFHNQYLMILAQTGLIGFGFMIWLFRELFRLQIKDPELKEFSVLGISIFAVACIAEPLWILQFPIILFVFIAAISIAASQETHYKIDKA
ncbi:MAG: O-antigen ligase family protein [Sulfuricurvum sp.]|nr:O-antigen ligase family protein [Sulfuricurvum sp.]